MVLKQQQKKSKRSRIILIFILNAIYLLIISGMTCDESLPPRLEPSQIYRVRLEIVTPYPEHIRRDIGEVMGGKGSLGFNVSIMNVFDETLSDTVRFEFGRIEIWWEENPEVLRTIPLTIQDEIITREIGPWGRITFDPGDSIYLAMTWPFLMDDDSTYMFNYSSIRRAMEFEAQAQVQLFEQTAMVYSDIIRFRIFFYTED